MRSPHIVLRALACCAVIFAASPSVAEPGGGFDPADLDRHVSPAADFYRFADGGWLHRNAIPPDRTSWGAFDEVLLRNERRVIGILRSQDAAQAPAGSERRKLGDYYAACTDVAGVERAGTRALRPTLATIDAVRTPDDLAGALAVEAFAGGDGGFAFTPEQDPKNATREIASVGQGGLSLPTREYYLSMEPRSRAIRTALVRYMRTTFRLLGEDDAAAARSSASVLALETQLARASKSPDDLRDPLANFHPTSLAGLQSLAPHVAWRTYFTRSGVSRNAFGRIDVNQPSFVRGFDALVTTVPLPVWREYLRWHEVRPLTVALPRAYRDAQFAFNRVFDGQPAPTPRERACARLIDASIGFALGNAYVAKYFPPAAKARAVREIAAIKASLADDIRRVAWMGPQTRAAALAKLAKLDTRKVGYPDRPRAYSSLAISHDDLLGDALASARFEMHREIAKIGRPLDRGDWGLTPQTVNAYYDPSMNEIVIPAGILEPPFFDPSADDALNFGGIGAVIGHELTHGFDDEGSDYDGDGNLHAIVTAGDAAKFHARVRCIVAQADAYTVPSVGLHLRGKLDAGEATADLGGTAIAYRALETSLAASGRLAPIDGFTPEQRFFLGWAHVWRNLTRPEAERAQMLGDPHPVSAYRVDATLSNEAPFYAAFAVHPGDPMYRVPAKRCAVW